jgi:glycosyltransferase involved in cell wall biosynthesis
MLISVVIPVLNAGDALRATLQSIRAAAASVDVEVLIQDGGSIDGIESVVAEFPDLVAGFSSGKDGGQYEAINAGFGRASGEVFSWLNAGDIFFPGAFDKVVEIFETHPDVVWLTGRQCIACGGNPLIFSPFDVMVSNKEIRYGLCSPAGTGFLQQEGMFWRRALWEDCGGLDTSLKLAADFDLWMRMAARAPLHRVSIVLAAFSYHGDNRSVLGASEYLQEMGVVMERGGIRRRTSVLAARCMGLFLKGASRIPVVRMLIAIPLWLIGFPRVETFDWRQKSGSCGSFELKRRRRISWVG